jgi:hypothetical protein
VENLRHGADVNAAAELRQSEIVPSGAAVDAGNGVLLNK